LFGQQLTLLSLTCGRGPAFVAVALPDGRRRLLRRTATDLDRPLALPVALPVALPRISARALLPLAWHIRSMLAASNTEALHANPSRSGSSAPPAATATSAATPAALGRAVSTGADPAGPTSRLPAPARPRGGASC